MKNYHLTRYEVWVQGSIVTDYETLKDMSMSIKKRLIGWENKQNFKKWYNMPEIATLNKKIWHCIMIIQCTSAKYFLLSLLSLWIYEWKASFFFLFRTKIYIWHIWQTNINRKFYDSFPFIHHLHMLNNFYIIHDYEEDVVNRITQDT